MISLLEIWAGTGTNRTEDSELILTKWPCCGYQRPYTECCQVVALITKPQTLEPRCLDVAACLAPQARNLLPQTLNLTCKTKTHKARTLSLLLVSYNSTSNEGNTNHNHDYRNSRIVSSPLCCQPPGHDVLEEPPRPSACAPLQSCQS